MDRYFAGLQAFSIRADYPKCMTRKHGAKRTRRVLAAAALSAALPASAAAAPADISTAESAAFVPGEVLVRYEAGTPKSERAELREGLDAELQRRLLLPRTELLELPPGLGVNAAVAELSGEADVAFAEPNFLYRVASAPNDDEFELQWGLDNDGVFGLADADIDAPEGWDLQTGDPTVVVGVVDTGVTIAHEDLDGNIWANPGESGGGLEANGIDDDGNDLVDDRRGWDFSAEDNDPTDEEGHGTHVAGTIGAEGDNLIGITGVAWDVSLLPLRACNALGSCSNGDVADAFAYAGEKGADVVNASISGSSPSSAQQLAIASAPDTLFVVAAGNEGGDNGVAPRYPCNYTAGNLICVAASNGVDERASFSNFGAASVDLAAPGGGSGGAPIRSTYMADRMNEAFAGALSGDWETGGTPDSWDRTAEASPLPGGTLTDSPGAPHAEDADNFARFGPVDLSADDRCNLRYDLALDLPDAGDRLWVQASSDGADYTSIQGWTGVGSAKLTPSITSFAGSPEVFVRFRLEADGDAEVGDGAHVDNVRIRCASSDYAYLQGTSMAAPHVSGAAALIRSHDAGSTVAELREWLLDGVELKPAFEDLVASGGRLNLHRSLRGADGDDIHRPETSITKAPATRSRSTTAGLTFASDEPASFQCSHNSAPFGACSSPLTLSGLAVGTHSLRVRAVDLAGNEDATPASYAFTVEPPRTKPRNAACAKAKRKLKRARSSKQKRELRKLVKRKCRK
ncbi:MAG: hypothetical protein FJW90_10465 [Actinobacteria bacterium]|nr:hypothetical protein [Actinomycetota bacterium]